MCVALLFAVLTLGAQPDLVDCDAGRGVAHARRQAEVLGIELVLGAIGAVVFYAALRRTCRSWWLWATGVAMVFMIFTAMIGPVYLAPIFNTYQPVQDPASRS